MDHQRMDAKLAEQAIKNELEKRNSRELSEMLGAVVAVKNRGDSEHIFEMAAIGYGLKLAKEQQIA